MLIYIKTRQFMKTLKSLLAVLFVASAFTACNEDIMNPSGISVDNLNSSTYVIPPVYCGGPDQYGLKGGQDMAYTGSVSVGNDENFLMIEVVSLKGFQSVTDGSIDVGFYKSLVPQSMPVTSSFKYHFTPNNGPNEYGIYIFNISIPLNEIKFEDDQVNVGLICGQPVNIIVHVDALMELIPGVLTAENAWGAGIEVKVFSDNLYVDRYKYINYTPACCTCEDETAWADGNPFPGRNWALFTPYTSGSILAVNLLAGQHNISGSVTLKPSVIPGMITLSIDLNNSENWYLQEVSEAVKVQGYSTVPSKSPIPGKFNTYKGNLLEINIPYFKYYGIHLDVKKCSF